MTIWPKFIVDPNVTGFSQYDGLLHKCPSKRWTRGCLSSGENNEIINRRAGWLVGDLKASVRALVMCRLSLDLH